MIAQSILEYGFIGEKENETMSSHQHGVLHMMTEVVEGAPSLGNRFLLAQGNRGDHGAAASAQGGGVASESAAQGGVTVPAVAAPSADVIPPTAGDISLFDKLDLQFAFNLFDKGGPVVVILFALSVIALTVVLIKIWQFTRLGVGGGGNADKALAMWIAGKREDAYDAVRSAVNPSAFVLAHGMRGVAAGAEEKLVREDVERVALTELSKMRSYMRVIEATVQIAPLLGLFGTVIGMIYAFQALQSAGSETDPAVLAGGIWVALLTTAVGLAIAIPAAFINYWLEGRIEREKEHMETALTGLFTQRITEADSSITALRPDAGTEIKHAAE